MVRPVSSGASLVAIAVGGLLAQAQAVAQEAKGGLEEVVVTAERREASLQTVPVPVTAITTEQLENRQVTAANDLARYAPSLKMFSNITTPTNLSPSLRGSLQQDASLIVAESPFGIYVDDVYMARLNGNNVTLSDIERVEVLRGPQGTLYGRNTLSGAVKFVTRTPGDKTWLNASVGAGNFDQQRATFSVGAPFGGSGFSGSLSGLYSKLGPQFYNRNPSVLDERGEEKNWALRGKLRYTGIDNLDIVFSASTSQSDNDGGQLIPASTPGVASNKQFTSDDLVPQFGTYVLNTPNVARAPGIANLPFEKLKQSILSLNVSYDLGGVTLKSITGYVNTQDRFTSDFSGNGNILTANDSATDQISEELQLVGKAFDDRLNYLVGAYFFREQGSQLFIWQSYLPPIIPVAVPVSRSLIDMKTESYSAFFQGDYKVTDNLKVTAGLRYTQDKKDFNLLFQGLLPPVTPASGVVPLKNKYTETTPRFGIDYTIPTSGSIDSMLLYASAAKGFKSGGYSAISIFNFSDARTPYGPEKNWTYEAGIKTDLFGRKLRINANYFMANIDDLTLNATVIVNGAATFPVQNSGKAEVKGLEYEITFAPTENLTTFLSGTVAGDGKYKSLRAGSAPANAPANFGVQPVVPQVPDWSFTVGAEYGVDVGAGRLSMGADWFQTADYITAATNDFKVKSYGVGTAFVNYGFADNWSVRAAVKNFTDNNTITTGSRGFLGGFIPLRPRTYLFSINYNMQ